MKFFVVLLAIAACTVAEQISNEYLPPLESTLSLPSNEYLPPLGNEPSGILADDGYRYKTVRRLKYRHRRDVNELPSNEYLPPVQQSFAPSQEYLPPTSAVFEPETVLADDGYRYKTVRRLKYRHRRDVNELPSNEYLPPVQQSFAPSQEYLPPTSAVFEPETVLADDGYRYKTVRRLKYRHRRDVNELPSNEYLPPVQQSFAPSQEYLPPTSAVFEPETVLADDGYRYKTVRRLKYRHRRDVNELPSNEYLPPVQQSFAPSQEYLPPTSAVFEPETVLANDGYRYKVVRKLKYRRH
ncbi:uncharacterized protein LOC129946426 [Eupeodes corollae]|uniref:uncharacterized protein LOC129946426 n=1 Tax=Eupeodes corollae TaxID=290404 RepID=UPI002491238D|nr:uncharacterized protein LOC129946426 [Eupeodes corollae]